MTVRWGFIGAGYVAKQAMAPAVHAAPGATLRAVASRDADRSAKLEPEVVHTSYDALLADKTVDAVYISLTNAQHAQWVIAALDAGKHVLCEKPLAMNAAEVRTMMEAAERNNRLLVEAVWTRWQPRMKRMAEVVQRGDLGDVLSVASAFTFQGDLTGNYRSLPEFGGGALLDVGCYQVHLWMMLLNEAITFHISDIERSMSAEGIDLTTNIQALVNDVVSVNASCSFNLPPAQSIRVTGTQTTMRTGDGEAFTLWKQPATLLIGDNVEYFPADDAFALMVESMSTNIREGTTPLFPMTSSLRVAEILDEIRTFQPEK